VQAVWKGIRRTRGTAPAKKTPELAIMRARARVRSEQARQCPVGLRRAAKNETALDHHQTRKHKAWYRHITLAMADHAWLAVTAARPPGPPPSGGSGDSGRAREGATSLWTTSRPGPDPQ
jgi:hypothetical protein